MHVRISDDDIATCVHAGAEMRRFLSLLSAKDTVGKDATTGLDKPNPFDEVALATSWGLLVFTFNAPSGSVTKAFNVELLALTKANIIGNDGVEVDRYHAIVDELLLEAKDQLLTGKRRPLHERNRPAPIYKVQD